jgi:hypothetical protein
LKVQVFGSSGFIGSQLCQYKKVFKSADKFLNFKTGIDIEGYKSCSVLYLKSKNETKFDEFTDETSEIKQLREFLFQSKTKHFIYVSSAKVHGSHPAGLIDSNTLNINSRYAEYHFSRENRFRALCKDVGCKYTVIRPFNVFGSRSLQVLSRNTLVPMEFILQAINQNKIVLKSNGKSTMNLVSVRQFANNIIEVLDKDPGCYSIASNWFPEVIEVAKIVQASFWKYKEFSIDVVPNLGSSSESNTFEISDGYKLTALPIQDTIEEFHNDVLVLINKILDLIKEKA